MSIAAGISATKAGFDLIKGATDLLRRPGMDPSEIQQRLLELQGLMLEAQRALGEAEEDNRHLKREIEELRTIGDLGKSLVYASHVYWIRKPDGELDGPYCTTCWDDGQKLVRLKYSSQGTFSGHEELGISRSYQCILHKSSYILPLAIFRDVAVR